MDAQIRLAAPSDGPTLAAIYTPAVTQSATSFEIDAPDAAEMARRVAATLERTPWLVCETAEGVVGYAYASRHRERLAYQWSVDVSAYIDPRHHRRGIGAALYASLFEILRRQGFVNAYAGITVPNPASIGLHEHLGFELVGVYRKVGWKLGCWHDVAWLGLTLGVHAEAPPPPRTLPDVVAERWMTEALAAGLPRLRQG